MNQLSVSRIISDHMVLQHGRPVHMWGTDAPGRKVRASIAAACVEAETDEAGRWSMFLPPMRADKNPHTLHISDDVGESISVQDVLIGDVFFCTGQSNMDLMIERVKDRYPELLKYFEDHSEPYIRTFKITEETNYAGELSEPHTGVWWIAEKDTILSFSATGYFFAKHYYEMTGIPVGFLHSSLGGSLISCWMSREMLSEATEAAPNGYTFALREADRYAGEKYIATQLARNERVAADWNLTLDQDEEMNRDLKFRGLPAGSLFVPGFFRDDPLLDGFIGKLCIRKKFSLTAQMLSEAKGVRRVRLLLGTLVDRDEVYLNGTKIGETFYQYPPRKYEVPVELLKEGDNEIEIRLIVEHGEGRFTPGKIFALICEQDKDVTIRTDKDQESIAGSVAWQVDLTGEWKYQACTQMPPMPETDFISWHPTGLYNAMTAPCHPCTISGILWYQGEANADKEDDYGDQLKRMIRGYRKRWTEASVPAGAYADDVEAAAALPFLCVQLPNFTVDLTEEESWPRIREDQRSCLSEPATGLVCTIDLGADNDLHPHDKEPLGYRLALMAAHMKHHKTEEYTGPMPERFERTDGGFRIILSHAEGLKEEEHGAGSKVTDLVGLTEMGTRVPLNAEIEPEEHAIRMTIAQEVSEKASGADGSGDDKAETEKVITADDIREIRYIDSNTYHGALVYNRAGLPMAPFRWTIY